MSFCPLFPWRGIFRQNDRKNIKLTHGNIDKRKNLYLCAFVKNKDTRTEEHKANTMKNNQINICHSAHYVILSKLKSSFCLKNSAYFGAFSVRVLSKSPYVW